MTRIVIGSGVLTASVAFAVTAVWLWWLKGTGRHRAAHRTAVSSPAPAVLQSPPAPAAGPGLDDQAEADTDTVALLLDADTADFAHCPAEGRTTPHFLHSNGTRTCARCETTTAGDQA